MEPTEQAFNYGKELQSHCRAIRQSQACTSDEVRIELSIPSFLYCRLLLIDRKVKPIKEKRREKDLEHLETLLTSTNADIISAA